MRLAAVAAGFAVGGASPASAATTTLTWDGGALNWGNSLSWVGDPAPTFGNETDVIFYQTGANNLTGNFLGANRIIRNLTYNADADSNVSTDLATASGGATGRDLNFSSSTGTSTITVDADAAGTFTIGTNAGTITLSNNLNVVHDGSGVLTLNRVIGESAVSSITKSGTGTLSLTRGNTFTGGVVINEGTVRDNTYLNGDSLLGLGTGPVTLGGGTLLLERSYNASSSSNLVINTTASTSSVIRYNDSNAATRNITFLSSSSTLDGDLLIENISTGAVDAIVWNKVTSGNGTLSYKSSNDAVLTDISTQRFQVGGDLSALVGGIEIQKGAWLASGANTLGGGAINIGVTGSADSAAITLNTGSPTTIANDINVRTATIGGGDSVTGAGNGVRLIDTNAQDVSTNWSGTITLNGDLTYKSANADDFTSASTLTGSGGLVKLGTGQLDLRGSNGSYSGNITVSEGELRTVNASLGSGDVSIASGANLSLQRTSGSILYSNNISGAGTMLVGGGNLIALGGANTSTGDITVGGGGTTLRIDNAAFNNSTANIITSASNSLLRLNANAADQTIANTISGNGYVFKQGNFKTTLTGANTYAGTTTVSAGSLQVGSAGVGQTGSGAVTVNSGSTILGSGIVQGSSFTAESGSTVHAGDGTAQSDYGTLTFTPVSGAGIYDIQSGSSIILGINPGGTSDRLVFNGDTGSTLTFSGNLKIGPDSFTPTSAEVFDLIDWAALVTPDFSGFSVGSNRDGSGDNGSQFDLPDIGAGWYWDVSQFTIDGSIAIVAVPVPSRVLLLGIGLLGVMIRRRR